MPDLHVSDAVGELIRQQTQRIHFLPGDPDRYYTVRAPSRLDQLADAVANSTAIRQGRPTTGSHLPLDAAAVDLWWHMQTTIHGIARQLGVDRHGPLPTLLRRTAAATAKPGNEPTAALLRRRCWCGDQTITAADCGRCWTHKIDAMLTPELADREIRGAACWECRTEQTDPATGTKLLLPTTTTIIDRDGERLRVPAIVVRTALLSAEEGSGILWIYRMCRACGAEGWLDYTTSSAA